MSKIINLTPHPITICTPSGEVIRTIPVSGWEFRLASGTVSASEQGFSAEFNGIPLTVTKFGELELVASKNNTWQEKPVLENGNLYIVSQLAKNSPQLVNDPAYAVPAQVVRDAEGKILGCQSLGL